MGLGLPFRARSTVLISTIAGLLIAIIWTILGYQLVAGRHAFLADARERAEQRVQILEDQTSRTFESAYLTVQRAVDWWGNQQEPPQLVRDAQAIDALLIADSSGHVVQSAPGSGPYALDLDDSEAFTTLRKHPEKEWSIGLPIVSSVTGQWSIPISQRLRTPSGEFGGTVVAYLSLSRMAALHKSVLSGSGSSAVFRSDAFALFRVPAHEDWIGKRLSGLKLFSEHLPRSPAATYAVPSAVDGSERIISYRQSAEVPVVVYHAVAIDDILAVWHSQFRANALAGFLAAIVIAALAAVLIRQLRQRDQATAILHESEKRYRLLIDTLPHGVVETDLEGRIVFSNTAFSQLLGLSTETIAGRNVSSILDTTRQHEGKRSGASSSSASSFERRANSYFAVVGNSDRNVPVQVDWSYKLNPNGETIGVVAVVTDVTARQEAENELQRTQAFLDVVIENIPDALFVKDVQQHRYALLNRAAEQLFGIERAELIGKNDYDFFPKEQADEFAAQDREVISLGQLKIVPEELVETPHRGLRLLKTKKMPLMDRHDEPLYVLSISEDITERRATEEQLRQIQKMEAIGQLTGGIAHDFNNLLMVVVGNSELLAEALKDKPELREAADMILIAADRGASLTQQLLAFARRQTLEPEFVDLNRALESMRQMLRRTLPANIEIRAAFSGDLRTTLVDRAQLETAILNLAVNAKDAMPDGGKLTIETANLDLDDHFACQHEIEAGRYVVVTVTDTGTGMSPEVLKRVFEPFFTTKEVGKGTGLGLSMVYGFAKQSGGHVSLHSELGYGTAAKLFLPCGEAEELDLGRDQTEAAVMQRGPETILVVEDEPDVRRFVAGQLCSLGYDIVEAADGMAALAELDNGARPDLLFTDIILPGGLNGRQVAEEARRRLPGIKVLFTSGYGESMISHHGQLEPGVCLLRKPYRKADLAREIRAALDDHSKALVA